VGDIEPEEEYSEKKWKRFAKSKLSITTYTNYVPHI
jgi:hypothetical protein